MFKIHFTINFILLNLFSFNSYALKSVNLLEPDELPKQICKVDFGSYTFCAATIISKNQILTASHCNSHLSKRGTISCLNGQKFRFTSNNMTFFDPNNIPAGLSEIKPLEASKHDLAVVKINEEFNIEGIPVFGVNSPADERHILESNYYSKCQLLGVGLNPFGTLGLAHGIKAPRYQGMSLHNPIEFIDVTGVAPHDSGGPLVCEVNDKVSKNQKVIVGVISRGKDNGESVQSVITSFSDIKNSEWLQKIIEL